MGEVLNIQPGELKFPFELKKQVSTSIRLENVTSEHVAFKVKTTSPKKYSVRPNTGVIPPQSSIEIIVTMQAQREYPPDMSCKDKFLVQSVLVPGATSGIEVSPELFNKDNGREVYEAKLRVVYLPPAQPPSPIIESAEEGLVESDTTPVPTSFPAEQNSKDISDLRAKLIEARAALAVMTEEKNKASRETERLQKELMKVPFTNTSRLGPKQDSAVQVKQGWSTLYLIIAIILAFFLGRFTV